MDVFLLVWFALCRCVHAMPKSKAKVVEEYIVSAKLDEGKNFPQIQQRSQLRGIFLKDGTEALPELNHSPPPHPTPAPHHSPKNAHQPSDDFDDRYIMEERDLLVHHHHLPPPAPPPPPPPPLALHYAPSFFAIGLITFLLLLNSLQTSLLILKSKGSLLGSVTGALGRRKRSALDGVSKYESHLQTTLNSSALQPHRIHTALHSMRNKKEKEKKVDCCLEDFLCRSGC